MQFFSWYLAGIGWVSPKVFSVERPPSSRSLPAGAGHSWTSLLPPCSFSGLREGLQHSVQDRSGQSGCLGTHCHVIPQVPRSQAALLSTRFPGTSCCVVSGAFWLVRRGPGRCGAPRSWGEGLAGVELLGLGGPLHHPGPSSARFRARPSQSQLCLNLNVSSASSTCWPHATPAVQYWNLLAALTSCKCYPEDFLIFIFKSLAMLVCLFPRGLSSKLMWLMLQHLCDNASGGSRCLSVCAEGLVSPCFPLPLL